MTFIKQMILITIGMSAGIITAASFVAFIAMLGIFPKIAAKTHTAKECLLYENCLMLGILFATLFQFFIAPNPAFTIYYSRSPLLFSKLLLCTFGLFGGIYVGFLIGGLSEVLNVLPIYARKTHTQKQIRYAIYFIALGKCFFTLLQFRYL